MIRIVSLKGFLIKGVYKDYFQWCLLGGLIWGGLTLTNQNLLLGRVPLKSILGFIIRSYTKVVRHGLSGRVDFHLLGGAVPYLEVPLGAFALREPAVLLEGGTCFPGEREVQPRLEFHEQCVSSARPSVTASASWVRSPWSSSSVG